MNVKNYKRKLALGLASTTVALMLGLNGQADAAEENSKVEKPTLAQMNQSLENRYADSWEEAANEYLLQQSIDTPTAEEGKAEEDAHADAWDKAAQENEIKQSIDTPTAEESKAEEDAHADAWDKAAQENEIKQNIDTPTAEESKAEDAHAKQTEELIKQQMNQLPSVEKEEMKEDATTQVGQAQEEIKVEQEDTNAEITANDYSYLKSIYTDIRDTVISHYKDLEKSITETTNVIKSKYNYIKQSIETARSAYHFYQNTSPALIDSVVNILGGKTLKNVNIDTSFKAPQSPKTVEEYIKYPFDYIYALGNQAYKITEKKYNQTYNTLQTAQTLYDLYKKNPKTVEAFVKTKELASSIINWFSWK
ncbi:hypothetical protein DOS70_10255 [Staphylococcus felis]|uniref:hypothetical protein n=1 Tax=Staphylococcus felis TaxID=46127 RepID=UPI000E2751CA|nr:hypothetical protein [Staphylococcus felis]REH93736.1 hypothetical protein DOS70_10255 [Staphylococcus felis]REI31375.1 hypothetical protein DOS81_02015 [Staphylococcus felis]